MVGRNAFGKACARAGQRAEILAATERFGALWLDDVRRHWCAGDASACSHVVGELVRAELCLVRRSREDARRKYLVVRPEGIAFLENRGYAVRGYPGSRYPSVHAERLADRARLLLELVSAGIPETWVLVGDEMRTLLRLPRNRSLVAAVRNADRTAVLLASPIPWRKLLAHLFDTASHIHLWVVLVESMGTWGKMVREWLDRRPTRRVWVPRPGEAALLLREYLTDPGSWEARLRQVLSPPARHTRSNPPLTIPGFELVTPRQRGSLVQTLCILDGRFCSLHDFRPMPVDLLANRLAMTEEDLQRGLEVSGIVGLVSDEKQAQQLARVLGWSRRFAYLWLGNGRACLWTVEGERLIARWAQPVEGQYLQK